MLISQDIVAYMYWRNTALQSQLLPTNGTSTVYINEVYKEVYGMSQ